MNTSGNTILITGGASGIGLALAERFIKAGNEVIIVGRREEKLKEAKNKFPMLHTKVCDVSDEKERQSLLQWTIENFPKLNILVNNAGIQQRVNLLSSREDWSYYNKEISINFEGPVHLCMLFAPTLIYKENPVIINISSGLGLAPGVWVPVYSATKAAIHSFTLSLRMQLSETKVNVVEVFPPAVNTDLGGVGLHTFGAPLGDFADAVFKGFENGDLEICYGGTENRLRAPMNEINQVTKSSWESFLKNNPSFLE